MRGSTVVRLALVAAAVVLSLASAQRQKRGSMKTAHETVVYDTRPTFTWKAEPGALYQLKLWKVPAPPGLREVVYEAHEVKGGSWTVPVDLDLDLRYELFLTLDRNVRVLDSWGFTVGMQQPSLAAPAAEPPLTTLEPEIVVAPLAYSDVVYTYDLATEPTFAKMVGQAQLVAPDLSWDPPLLQAGTTYHWRLRAHHFKHGTLKPDAPAPDLATAIGMTETTGSFSVAEQSAADHLIGLSWIMNEVTGASMPAVSKRYDLAYVVEADGGGSTIRIAPSTTPAPAKKKKAPPPTATYSDARVDLTEAVSGSRDQHPVWDVDGKGVFFDSDRSQGVRNVWLKKQDSSGYTQITFHNEGASFPSLSKDGKKIVYQVGDHIWIADRTGQNARELGPGTHPRFSPDGTRIAFALADETGQRHLWVMDVAGETRTQVTTGGDDSLPAWSGDDLVFVSTRAGNDDIWMVSSLGGDPMQITTYLGRDTLPAVAGTKLLFASQRGGAAMGIWIGDLPALPPPGGPTAVDDDME